MISLPKKEKMDFSQREGFRKLTLTAIFHMPGIRLGTSQRLSQVCTGISLSSKYSLKNVSQVVWDLPEQVTQLFRHLQDAEISLDRH